MNNERMAKTHKIGDTITVIDVRDGNLKSAVIINHCIDGKKLTGATVRFNDGRTQETSEEFLDW